ncbi:MULTISPECIES: class D sortase [Bacillus subtilis group]|uniref:class D sortase n=1 Tax=Bacillus subtilis group TaxID=653685 RepID=UPI00227FC5E0|nr:class D sortase [Bacillus halotolerans]MCY8475274.1 class D sortase [Bacillus halotolerans]
MKKYLPIFIIIAGLVFIGYGVWEVVDISHKTEQTLDEAKLALKSPSGNNVGSDKEEFKPKFGEAVGILEIPKINAELPIVEGTDADDLEKGVGHYKGSYYPDENGQIVLSGHRDTVFRRTGELKKGDQLKVKLPYGSFKYKIENMKIVDKNDTSIITLQHSEEELILTTCYPFSYIGNAPKRYIIYGKRI